jgi:hypothetical protein
MGKGESRFGTVNFEKRQHPRFSIDLPVECWKTDDPKSHPGHTGNIGEGGLLLYFPGELEIGQSLKLRLYIDSGLDFISVEALAEVVWKDLCLKEKGDYKIGVKFVHISAKDKANLKNFLESLVELKTTPKLNIPSKLFSTLAMPTLGNLSSLVPKIPDQE